MGDEKSDPPNHSDVKIAGIHRGLAVDVAGIVSLTTLLMARAVVGHELLCVGGILAIVGVAQALRGTGKGGSAILLIASAVPMLMKALFAQRFMLALVLPFVVGCAALLPIASTALQTLAPVALEAVKRRLEQPGSPTCLAIDDEYASDDYAIVVCRGAGYLDAAAVALRMSAAEREVTIDETGAICEPDDGFAVCSAPVVE